MRNNLVKMCCRSFLFHVSTIYSANQFFGTMWCKLHTGPMWSIPRIAKDGTVDPVKSRKIEEVCELYNIIFHCQWPAFF